MSSQWRYENTHFRPEVQVTATLTIITSNIVTLLMTYMCIIFSVTITTCPTLDAPENGMIDCSLGDDGLPTNRDTCTFTCNPGFELNGRKTRTCRTRRGQGTWNGDDNTCTPGIHTTVTDL